MKTESQLSKKTWWNRPLFGNVSLWQRIYSTLNRQKIPDSVLSSYNQELDNVQKIEPNLRMLDNGQYSSEFLFYAGLKQKIENDVDEYKGLAHFIKVFSFTIKNIQHFQVLTRVELDFRDKTQVQFYQFIEEQLISNAPSKSIRKAIRNEIKNLILTTHNEPTKEALISYKKALESLITRKSGVKLLGFLKKNKITDYSIFDVFYFLIKETQDQNLKNLKFIVFIVKNKKDELDKACKLIGFPSSENNTIIYAKIIQYIALSYRYEHITFRFEQFLEILKKWSQHYQKILNLKEEYPAYKYHYPDSFAQNIPGLSIYLKYKDFILGE